MAPTIVFDAEGRPVLALGSAGGALIIGYVAKTLVAILDWDMDPQRAADFGNVGNLNGPVLLEAGGETAAWKARLEALGHAVTTGDMTSGTQVVVIAPGRLKGGADGRREGVAVGD
jgi:gamma-glutamyltranspeptidase/glutathione hydrolase